MKAAKILNISAFGRRTFSIREQLIKRQLIKALPIGMLCALFATEAAALPSDREKPIHISSDSADIDDATGIAIYRGNVIMDQGTTQLKGDTVTLYVSNKKIKRIVSKGNAQTQAYYEEEQTDNQGILKAWANTIDYNLVKETVALTTKARLIQNGDTFVGNNIDYDQKKQLVNAKGGTGKKGSGRVQMVIQPDQHN